MFDSMSCHDAQSSIDAVSSPRQLGFSPREAGATILVAARPSNQHSAAIARLIEDKAELERQLKEALLQLGLLQGILHTRSL